MRTRLLRRDAGKVLLWTALAVAQCARGAPAPLDTVATLAASLSKPDAARILPAFTALDRSGYWNKALAPLTEPYPDGDAGTRELIARVGAVRAGILGHFAPSVWAAEFRGVPFTPSGQSPAGPAPDLSRIVLTLDLAPAQAIVGLLAAREQDQGRILARLRQPDVRPVFEALIRHRSQSFYGAPMSWELLAQNLALASSDAPLARLYAEAQPFAFLDFAEVRRNLPAYQALLRELETHKAALQAQTVAALQAYAPAGLAFSRQVSFLFCNGADGWADGEVAGIDLEYFKDDYARLATLLVHESYHVAQHAALVPPAAPAADPDRALWDEALDTLYGEGSATFVAPPKVLAPAQMQAMIGSAQSLLVDLERALFVEHDRKRAQNLVDEGSANAGPLYWLGREMSRVIVEDGGAAALGAVLPQGATGFVRAYQRAAARRHGAALIPAPVARRVASLAGGS